MKLILEMGENWMYLIVMLICAAVAFLCVREKHKFYQSIDRMLEELLDDRPVTETDLQEGQLSAFAGKARRIQEKLQAEVGGAKQENEQVKSLISNMSHQLKTPLSNIMMYEELLEGEGISELERKKFLEKMKAQSEKVSWILNSLFKMVKLEENVISFEAEGNFIRKTILDAVNLVYDKAQKKQIEIDTEYFPDCRLYHNSKWTSEVFANILENAVKYTEESGHIFIGMRRYEMYSEIWIRDTGAGIASGELTEIFKRFYRSQAVENVEGSGIGLYLSKLILEKEKGYLNVESHLGKGSCFSVFLQNCAE